LAPAATNGKKYKRRIEEIRCAFCIEIGIFGLRLA
jgi:hypothetical protein